MKMRTKGARNRGCVSCKGMFVYSALIFLIRFYCFRVPDDQLILGLENVCRCVDKTRLKAIIPSGESNEKTYLPQTPPH